MEKTVLIEKDFKLNKEYELFDVIYSVSKKPFENEVKAWTVIGHVLNSSATHRCFEYELCSYPISVFVSKNEKLKLSDLRDDFISKDKKQIITQKKELLSLFFNDQLNNLK